ncbi:hypothetical protein BDV32DRAFT_119277 [Aspergillus pseudonomiae]|nr:hypothetical protein BDV32DRAFT_119277 [Aspergillus pseudonomiae]
MGTSSGIVQNLLIAPGSSELLPASSKNLRESNVQALSPQSSFPQIEAFLVCSSSAAIYRGQFSMVVVVVFRLSSHWMNGPRSGYHTGTP